MLSGSGWVGQQLHKAYQGLTFGLAAGSPPSDPIHDQNKAVGDSQKRNVSLGDKHCLTQAAAAQCSDSQPAAVRNPAQQQQQQLQPASDQSHQQPQPGLPLTTPLQPVTAAAASLDWHDCTDPRQLPEECADQHHMSKATDQQQQQDQLVEQELQKELGQSAGSESISRHAVESQKLQEISPADVALESPHTAAAGHMNQKAAEDSEANLGSAGGAAQKLDKPQVLQTQQQKQTKASPTPVFVPIVVAMDAQDHKVMVEEWYSRRLVSCCI